MNVRHAHKLQIMQLIDPSSDICNQYAKHIVMIALQLIIDDELLELILKYWILEKKQTVSVMYLG